MRIPPVQSFVTSRGNERIKLSKSGGEVHKTLLKIKRGESPKGAKDSTTN